MNNRPARVAAIHDLSGYGRCSLSVILPVISAMGVQVCPVPTAILSSHTGGLGDVALRDLTDFTLPALEHYKRLELEFECIYSGFLSSVEQVDHCLEFFSAYPSALAVVDPVMGDHGKPYRTCGPELRAGMGKLVRAADIITPNLTEAGMLLGMDCASSPLTVSEARSLLVKLGELGPQRVVITGAELAGGIMANIGYDRERGAFWRVNCKYIPVSYPGTGDIFASVLVGGLLNGDSLPMAMDRATKFLEVTIKTTYSYGADTRGGVMLEKSLNLLSRDDLPAGYQAL